MIIKINSNETGILKQIKENEIVRVYSVDSKTGRLKDGGTYYYYKGQYKQDTKLAIQFIRLQIPRTTFDFDYNYFILDHLELTTLDIDKRTYKIINNYGLYNPYGKRKLLKEHKKGG